MRAVFKKPAYLIFAAAAAFLFYAMSVWIPLWSLLRYVDGPTALRLLALSLIDLGAADMFLALALAFLVGINAALLLFYLKRYGLQAKTATASAMLGTITGILGFGCAACGSLFFTTLLASVVGIGIATAFPVSGIIFQFVGIALLVFSIIKLSRSISKPHTCPIDEG